MTPFYTAKGDSGKTGLLGEGRVSKASLQIEAVGSVDEATAALGLARAQTESQETREIILHIQKSLYRLMAELAATPETADQFRSIDREEVAWLEHQINQLETTVNLPREFILPGETPASGALALARTIVRRAERRVIALKEAEVVGNPDLIAFLNRLSSLVFLLEVHEATRYGRGVRLAKGE